MADTGNQISIEIAKNDDHIENEKNDRPKDLNSDTDAKENVDSSNGQKIAENSNSQIPNEATSNREMPMDSTNIDKLIIEVKSKNPTNVEASLNEIENLQELIEIKQRHEK